MAHPFTASACQLGTNRMLHIVVSRPHSCSTTADRAFETASPLDSPACQH